MANYLQIGDDPTTWWLVQPFDANELTGQPLALELAGPLGGALVLSGRFASVAVVDVPDATVPAILNPSVGAIYLPTATGPSAQHYGYSLPPGTDVDNLAGEIATAMRDRTRQVITLLGGGTLVLDGGMLSFVVIQPGVQQLAPVRAPVSPHDSSPHG
jgi:hypothetical protein